MVTRLMSRVTSHTSFKKRKAEYVYRYVYFEEHRYLIMGQSTAGRLLIVSYTERDDVIRLISAREMTLSERRVYAEG
jgi:uncharacterized DUF497 family protein